MQISKLSICLPVPVVFCLQAHFFFFVCFRFCSMSPPLLLKIHHDCRPFLFLCDRSQYLQQILLSAFRSAKNQPAKQRPQIQRNDGCLIHIVSKRNGIRIRQKCLYLCILQKIIQSCTVRNLRNASGMCTRPAIRHFSTRIPKLLQTFIVIFCINRQRHLAFQYPFSLLPESTSRYRLRRRRYLSQMQKLHILKPIRKT